MRKEGLANKDQEIHSRMPSFEDESEKKGLFMLCLESLDTNMYLEEKSLHFYLLLSMAWNT